MLEQVASDDVALVGALTSESLPTADLVAPNKLFWRLIHSGGVVGYVGLEIHGTDALLRSVVVDRGFKGKGLGRRLVDSAMVEAKARDIDSLWLLTKTAEPFFGHLGWQVRDRADAPADVAQSEEFMGLCPASATCMSLSLKG